MWYIRSNDLVHEIREKQKNVRKQSIDLQQVEVFDSHLQESTPQTGNYIIYIAIYIYIYILNF